MIESQSQILIRVIPNSKQNAIIGFDETNHLKIKLSAPPVDSKANKALIAFLADMLHCRSRSIEIVSGLRSRQKRVLIKGYSDHDIQERLSTFI
mgnify:CR=1 FL=1